MVEAIGKVGSWRLESIGKVEVEVQQVGGWRIEATRKIKD